MNEQGYLWLLNENANMKSIPSPSDFEVFGKAILCCANGDGRISPAERAWVIGYLDAYGAPKSTLEKLQTYEAKEDIAQILNSSPTKKVAATGLLYDAVRACYADGELQNGERQGLEKMGRAMGIDAATVRDLIELYHEEQSLKAKRLRRIFPEGNPFEG